eukprot:6192777-Pleurochrysis_carterae.AAC.1
MTPSPRSTFLILARAVALRQLLQLGRLGSLQLRQRQYGAARRTLAEALAIAIAIGANLQITCSTAFIVSFVSSLQAPLLDSTELSLRVLLYFSVGRHVKKLARRTQKEQ